MPAPERPSPYQSFANALNPTKGIVGYYSDAEIDALLAALPSGGGLQTVDLSAYATTAYVDGQIATVYSKAEVDAAIKAASEQAALDLDAVQSQLVFAIEETGKQTQAKIDLKADKDTTYTKTEVDEKFVDAASGGTIDLSGYATTQNLDDTKTEILTAATAAFQERYTKQETDGLFVKQADLVAPPNLDGYATEQYVDDSIARIPATDLTGYAKLDDATQTIVAGTIQAARHEFTGNAALAWEDVGGVSRPVYKAGTKTFTLAFTSEVGGDLSAYAKLQDNQQPFLAKTVVSQAYGFGDTLLPPVALGYSDTGEGYGNRLVLNVGLTNEYLVYKSDLDSLNALLPRIESLESKAAPAVDLSAYATVDGCEAVYAKKSELSGYATTGFVTTYLAPYAKTTDVANVLSGYAKTTDVATTLLVYSKTADVAAFVEQNYTPKDTCYPKAETYTKVEVDDLIARTPSPMRYLQWGGAFQKVTMGSGNKDKWVAAGLIPSIQIVKGKHYRLEFTMKMGQINTDIQMAWVGLRFNYRTINELPCTKEPLVNIGGWGTTTVLRDRPQIAANPVATTTPTRADRFRLCFADDWASTSDVLEYAVEFEADRDIASANFVPEFCAGGTWGTFPADITGMVAVFRQMD